MLKIADAHGDKDGSGLQSDAEHTQNFFGGTIS